MLFVNTLLEKIGYVSLFNNPNSSFLKMFNLVNNSLKDFIAMKIIIINFLYLQLLSLKIFVVLSTNTKLLLLFFRAKTKKR